MAKINIIMDEEDFKKIVLILCETEHFAKFPDNLRLQNAWRTSPKIISRVLKLNHYRISYGKQGIKLTKLEEKTCQGVSDT